MFIVPNLFSCLKYVPEKVYNKIAVFVSRTRTHLSYTEWHVISSAHTFYFHLHRLETQEFPPHFFSPPTKSSFGFPPFPYAISLIVRNLPSSMVHKFP